MWTNKRSYPQKYPLKNGLCTELSTFIHSYPPYKMCVKTAQKRKRRWSLPFFIGLFLQSQAAFKLALIKVGVKALLI